MLIIDYSAHVEGLKSNTIPAIWQALKYFWNNFTMYNNESAIINVPFKRSQEFRKKCKRKALKVTQSLGIFRKNIRLQIRAFFQVLLIRGDGYINFFWIYHI